MKWPADKSGRMPRVLIAQSSPRVLLRDGHAFFQLVGKYIERGLVGIPLRFDYGIEGPQGSKDLCPHDLPEPALETITRNGGVTVFRNDEPDTRMTQRGSEDSDLEMLGPNSLPLSPYLLNVRTLREPMAPREGESTRRQRTWLAA